MDSIPTEILLHILSFSIPSKRQRRVRRPLSRVCHFWRDAIYGNPFFWMEIRLHRTTEELQEILRLNPDGPLDVIWAPSNPGKLIGEAGMRRAAMISPHSQRWRSLVLAGTITGDMRAKLIDVPTPQLVNLNIDGWFLGGPGIDLAREGAPLRALTLGSAALDWESPRLRGLRCLRLHTPGDKTPTVEELHAILSSSPGLEILDLAYWGSLFHSQSQIKKLGAVFLPSLTTLAADEVPFTVLQMLLSCIRAPSCRYIRLPMIRQTLFLHEDLLEELVKLCQGPLSTVPRLLIAYDRAGGSCTITHRDTELAPQPNIREYSVKLAKRRGVYLRTARIFNPDLNAEAVQSSEAGIRRFIKEGIQPALRNLSIGVQLDLHHWWPRSTDTPSNPPLSVVTDLLLNVPLVTHLRVRSHFDPTDVLPFISTRQTVGRTDEETRPEPSWPVPHMESLTVACETRNRDKVFESLNDLISKRGPQVHHGTAMAFEQKEECGDGASQPPRHLKHIVVQDKTERDLKVWDSEHGWREC